MFWLEPGPLSSTTTNIVYLCRPKIKHVKIIAGMFEVVSWSPVGSQFARSDQETCSRTQEAYVHSYADPSCHYFSHPNLGRGGSAGRSDINGVEPAVYPLGGRCHIPGI